MQGFPKGSPRARRLPTHAELLAAGRHDLRYALQVGHLVTFNRSP